MQLIATLSTSARLSSSSSASFIIPLRLRLRPSSTSSFSLPLLFYRSHFFHTQVNSVHFSSLPLSCKNNNDNNDKRRDVDSLSRLLHGSRRLRSVSAAETHWGSKWGFQARYKSTSTLNVEPEAGAEIEVEAGKNKGIKSWSFEEVSFFFWIW